MVDSWDSRQLKKSEKRENTYTFSQCVSISKNSSVFVLIMTFSIITINLNNSVGLKKTAESISSQSCKDYEWIVIDGGSTDGSRDIISGYSDIISYSVSEPDAGIYNAMNKGVEVANGDYLMFLNSGDCLYDKDVLSDFIKQKRKGDIVYGNTERVDQNSMHSGEDVPARHISLQYLLYKRLNHQSMFFSRECFTNRRYDESFRLLGDMELMVRLAMQGVKFVYWDRCIVKYDVTGISARIDTKPEIDKAIEKNIPEFILLDYAESTYNDSDIARMSRDIIDSNRFIRTLTRLFMYPIYGMHKLLKKSSL